MISYGRQSIDECDIKAVVDCLRSDFLTQGPQVPKFEQTLASLVGAEHAIAANSGTSAIHLACLALDVGPGDHVWTSPITFVASANAPLYCGATVDFVDIDPNTNNLCTTALRKKLKSASKVNALPKVVIPVHLAGHSCDMAEIQNLAQEFGFSVIEDAAHALGSSYGGHPIGSCKYSDITIFSFHPVKTITTGEGGAATTNDEALAKKMGQLRSHGVTRDFTSFISEDTPVWGYEQHTLGFNYRLSDLAASLGTTQLSKLNDFIQKRRSLAESYFNLLGKSHLELPDPKYLTSSAWHLFIVSVPGCRNSRDEIFETMRNRHVGVNLHYPPVHLQPFYRERGFNPGDFPVAEAYAQRAITLPLHPGLHQRDVCHVASVLLELTS